MSRTFTITGTARTSPPARRGEMTGEAYVKQLAQNAGAAPFEGH